MNKMTKREEIGILYIYQAEVAETLTDGEYQMEEISLCEYSDDWNGDVSGYLDNIYGGEADIRGEELGAVRQNFGGLDPVEGSIRVVCYGGKPSIVYWASAKLASWAV